MNKTLASLGHTLGLAAGGVAGFAFTNGAGVSGAATAATETTTDSGTAADTDRAAERAARLTEILQPLVDAGTLTQAQLDAVVTTLQDAAPVGGGHGGRGGRLGDNAEAAATALGMTLDELRTELQGGSTIAEIATAKGVDLQTVVDALVAQATERINDKVADGSLTQEEADARLAEVTERVTAAVNGEGPLGGRGGRGHGGPRGDEVPADAPADDATTEDAPAGS